MALEILLTVGVTMVVLFLGSLVYLHDRASATNQFFVILAVVTALYTVANFFSLQVSSRYTIHLIRATVFFAVPHAVLFLVFIYNFPSRDLVLGKKISRFLLWGTFAVMLLSITPLVFSDVEYRGDQIVPVPGPLAPIFPLTTAGSFLAGLVLMVRKYWQADRIERIQWRPFFIGVGLTYALLISIALFGVIIFGQSNALQYVPLFFLPFILLGAYTILRHRLFNVRIIAAEVFIFLILLLSSFELITAEGIRGVTLQVLILGIFFILSVFLVRSVLREVEQKEELERLTAELAAANEKLKKLDQAKTEFLSIASHQLRSPLTAIKGFLSLMMEGDYGKPTKEQKTVIDKLQQTSERLIKLVGDLLNVSRIEMGRLVLEKEELDVKKLVKSIVEELEVLAEQKGLKFETHYPREKVIIGGDNEKLRQVFLNLIDNAIKYTEKGSVTVTVTKEGAEKVVVAVSDTGRGIAEEERASLFEKFRRGRRIATTTEGTGFGLYLARELVRAHGGEVTVQSEGHDKGSTFRVELPVEGGGKRVSEVSEGNEKSE